MKTKDCERVVETYKQGFYCIHLGVDNTDHIAFFCPKCSKALRVIEVESKNVRINPKTQEKDNCTWIWMACDDCKLLGKRKFYWTTEDGKFCAWHTKPKKKKK